MNIRRITWALPALALLMAAPGRFGLPLQAQSSNGPGAPALHISGLDLPEPDDADPATVLSYSRPSGGVISVDAIEVSRHLRTWTPLPAGAVERTRVVADPNGRLERVTVRLMQPGALEAENFYRLRGTQHIVFNYLVQSYRVDFPGRAFPDDAGDPPVVADGIFHDRRTGQSTTSLRIKNPTASPIGTPLIVEIESLSDPTVSVANADGVTLVTGNPYFDFSGQVPGVALDPDETTASRPVVFNNPGLKAFSMVVSVYQTIGWTPGSVTLQLTTDGNQSVIMASDLPSILGVPAGVGEELIVTVTDTTDPTAVDLDQVMMPHGRGVVYFGASGSALSASVVTSGGTPNQARLTVRHATTSAFGGDVKLRASVSSAVQAEKFVTALFVRVTPKCVYTSDQQAVRQILAVTPPLSGLKFQVNPFLVRLTQGRATSLPVTPGWPDTDISGTSSRMVSDLGYQAYVYNQTSPLRTLASSVESPYVTDDRRNVRVSNFQSDPDGVPGPGSAACQNCPGPSPTDAVTGPGAANLPTGEESRIEPEARIRGRGLDYAFRKTYLGGDQPLAGGGGARSDFARGWTFSHAGEFLVKDGSGPADLANYIHVRDAGAAYVFVNVGSGEWAPEAQYYARLRLRPDQDIEVRDQDGLLARFHAFTGSGTPNTDGRLRELRDRHGNRESFLYDAIDPDGVAASGDEKMVVTRVIDSLGREIRHVYYAATAQSSGTRTLTIASANPGAWGRLARVIDFKGDMDFDGTPSSADFPGQANNRTLVFDYDAEGNLVRASRPAVAGTPNGNDFPSGRTHRYHYIMDPDLPGLVPGWAGLGLQEQDRVRGRLLHKLLRVWRPNEVGSNPSIDPADPQAALTLTYDVNPASRFLGYVVSRKSGGVNATGVPAGGSVQYTYTDLNPLRNMPPGVNLNLGILLGLESLQVGVQDARGNQAEYVWGGENDLLRVTEFTRGLRSNEPAGYTTSYQYDSDRRLVRRVEPEGNTVQWTYDEGNPDRYQQGNLLEVTRIPDALRGGDQAALTTRYAYDPIYNQPCLVIEPRGTDPSFVPPFGGPASAGRYASSYVFDYQEGPDNATQRQRLADELGVSLATIDAIIATNEAQVETLLGLPPGSVNLLGYGDVNGDGRTDQIQGNHLRQNRPRVHLLPGSNQAAIEGGTMQPVIETYVYNDFGQLIQRVDPEGNVHTAEYYPETDPDGDAQPTPAPADGRVLDPTTGGYLRTQSLDVSANPGRDNGSDPAPTALRTTFFYDDVGNVIEQVNGRGIRTDYYVNEADETVQTTAAADVAGAATADPAEPLSGHPDPQQRLTSFGYLTSTTYDFNGNVIQRDVEDRGDTSNTGGFVTTQYQYDMLDHRLLTSQEVDVSQSLMTRYRYDANGNLVMTILPEGNAASMVYDERDLLFRSTRGADTRPSDGLFGAGDPSNFDRPGGAGTVPSVSTYNYDANRNVVEGVDAEPNGGTSSTRAGVGDMTRYQYDGFDRRTRTTDPLGNVTISTYDPASNIIRSRRDGDPLDDGPGAADNRTLSATEFIYDELSRTVATHQVLFQTPDRPPTRAPILTDTPAMDTLAPYLADASGDTAAVPGAVGITVLGRITTLTEYDRTSRETFVIRDDLDVERTDYDGAGRVIRSLDSALSNGFGGGAFNPSGLSGNAIQAAYDDNGNVIERLETDVTTVPDVPVETFRTTYLYDSLDRLQTTFDNRGHTMDYRYDSRGNQVASSDAEGPVTTRTFDRRGLGSSASVTVNDYGNVIRYAYDGQNRLVHSAKTLTASGQGDGVSAGATIEGVPTAGPTADPGQSEDGLITTSHAYDRNNRRIALRDDDGNTTAFLYDNQDRVLTETRGLNAGYQGTGFIIAGGDSGAFDQPRSPAGPLADPPVDTEPAGTSTTFLYDRDGHVLQRQDDAGNILSYTYDGMDRRTALSVSPAPGFVGTTSQTWFYDGRSRLVRSFDNNDPALPGDDARTTYIYDSLDRRIEETQQTGALPPRAVTCHYDVASSASSGQMSSCIYPDGRRLDSFYDGMDRLVRRRDNGAASDIGTYEYLGPVRIATLTYQNNTRLTHISQVAGLNADTGHDNLRRVVGHRWESFAPATPLGNGTLIVGFAYQDAAGASAYDRMDNKLIEEKLHDPDSSEVYLYDSGYRLTDPGASYRGRAGAFKRGQLNPARTDVSAPTSLPGRLQRQDWNLDGLGNWTDNTHTTAGTPAVEHRTHSDYNETVQVSGTPYGGGVTGLHILDANGNLLDDGVRVCQWDALNRLRQVSRKSDGLVVGTYSYDSHARRLRKVVTNGGLDGTAANGTTDYCYHDWEVVEERDGSDLTQFQLVYGASLDELWCLDRRTGGITVADLNSPGSGSTTDRHFYHLNTLFNVFALTDEVGLLGEAVSSYDAYGRMTLLSGPGGDGQWFTGDDSVAGVSGLGNTRWFNGAQVLDDESHLVYNRNRYYSPDLGRYVSRDPVGHDDSENLYEYVGSRPTYFIDPDGLRKKKGEIIKLDCIARERCHGVVWTQVSQWRIDCFGREPFECVCMVAGQKVWLGLVSPNQREGRPREEREMRRRGFRTYYWETPGEYEWGDDGAPSGDANRWGNNACPECTCVDTLFVAGHGGMVHEAAEGLVRGTDFCEPCTIYLKGCQTCIGTSGEQAKAIAQQSRCAVKGTSTETTTGIADPGGWIDPRPGNGGGKKGKGKPKGR